VIERIVLEIDSSNDKYQSFMDKIVDKVTS